MMNENLAEELLSMMGNEQKRTLFITAVCAVIFLCIMLVVIINIGYRFFKKCFRQQKKQYTPPWEIFCRQEEIRQYDPDVKVICPYCGNRCKYGHGTCSRCGGALNYDKTAENEQL